MRYEIGQLGFKASNSHGLYTLKLDDSEWWGVGLRSLRNVMLAIVNMSRSFENMGFGCLLWSCSICCGCTNNIPI